MKNQLELLAIRLQKKRNAYINSDNDIQRQIEVANNEVMWQIGDMIEEILNTSDREILDEIEEAKK